MSPVDPQHPRRTDLRDAPPALAWVIRIGFTVFAIPFLIIGLSMVLGGGTFGGFGWFGSLFGLPFIAVPVIMIAAVWLSPKRTQTSSGTAPESAPPPLPACSYCGRPRLQGSVRCESCGGH